MSYSESYKGYTIKGWSRNYRTYDPNGKEISLFGHQTDTRGHLRKAIRERIDELIDRKQ